jgi:O-succinylbenzoic acid--CoA ligase
MMVDLEFQKNQLLLNPRLPQIVHGRFESAWQTLVEPRFVRHVGVSTSGSSGDSIGRLILLSKDALEASAGAVNERFKSDSKDIWFKSLPSFHVGGLGILVRAKLSGARVYEYRSEKWNARDFVDQVVSSRATLISLVPTQVFDLVQAHIQAPSHVRAVIVGGGRLEESLRLKALDLGWPCLPSYGMTETCSQIATAVSIDDPSLRLLSHAEARSAADGRLEVKGPSLLSAQIIFGVDGKESNPQLTDPKHDGWLTTEDRAQVENGTLIVEGRTSDFVKIGGEGIVVARLEERLEQEKFASHFTKDAALLAAHDDRLGGTIVLITTASEDQADALVTRFNAGVAPFERIRLVKYVESVPRSPLGKILRGAAFDLIGLKPIAH